MKQHRRPPAVRCLLIDLDDTLYETPFMAKRCAENIRAYMRDRLGIPAADVEELSLSYYLNFGTSMAGLVANGYKIDYDDWHAAVHGTLPYEEYLKPDPKLRAMLDSIPVPKYIFTNADAKHTERCLRLLGLADCFAGVICFESVMAAAEERGLVHHGRPVVCKPSRQAMEIALRLAGGPDPGATVFFDDSTRNIGMAARAGVHSVLVGRTGVECAADLQIKSMHDLPLVMPWLWGGSGGLDQGAAAGGEDGVEADEGTIGTAVYVQA